MRPWKTSCEMSSRPPARQYFTYGPWEFNIRKAEILQRPVRAITLDLTDSLKVLKSPEHFVQEMTRDGQMLGLLPSD